MPASYQISVARLEAHRGKRDGARRQGGEVLRGHRGPTVATRGAVRFGTLALTVTMAAVGLSGLGGCSIFTGSGCTNNQDTTWDLHEPTDPSTTLKIEDCRDDVSACQVLCTMELDQNVVDQPIEQMTGCEVRFDGSTIHVEVKYDISSDTPGCDEPEPIEQPGTGGAPI
jgi:hypothetical protein